MSATPAPARAPNSAPGAGPAGPVLLFDGECGLCQRIVRLLLRFDRRAVLHFAALQSAPAQAFLRARGLPTDDFDSLVFVPAWSRRHDAPFLTRTAGVIAALRAIGGVGPALAALLALLPAAWRDVGYRLVARWRHRIFGPWRPRPLARAGWTSRFLA